MRARILVLCIAVMFAHVVGGDNGYGYSLMQFFEHPQTDSPVYYIQEKTMHLWTALDLLHAITVVEEERVCFCQEFISELLDLHTFIRSVEGQDIIAEDHMAYISSIVDRLEETFEEVFGRFSHDEVSCIRIMIQRLHGALRKLVR